MMVDKHKQLWLARILARGLELGIVPAPLVIEHLTPEVLATYLPPGVMSSILTSALANGRLTPDGILASAPPDILANYVPPRVLWACVSAAAEQAQIATPSSAPLAPRGQAG